MSLLQEVVSPPQCKFTNATIEVVEASTKQNKVADLTTGLGGAKLKKVYHVASNDRNAKWKDQNGNWKIEELIKHIEKLKQQCIKNDVNKETFEFMKCELDDRKRQSKLEEEMQFEAKRRYEMAEIENKGLLQRETELKNELEVIKIKNLSYITEMKLLQKDNGILQKELDKCREKEKLLEDQSAWQLTKIEDLTEEHGQLLKKVAALKVKLFKVKEYVMSAANILKSKTKFWKSSTKNRKVRATDIIDSILSEYPSLH